MANKSVGLLGRKIGMTQLFDSEGVMVPVTVIDASGNAVITVKTDDGVDGYTAVQLGIDAAKDKRTSKAVKGHFAKVELSPRKHVREIRLNPGDESKYPVGQELGVDGLFNAGDIVDVTGTSKGRGFTGVMKRYGFKGFIRSHGTHEYFRHGGSIGTRLTPGMVFKGKKMTGHHGAARVTIQNLKIARIDAEKGLIFIRGGVPGPNGGYLLVRKAVKKD